MLPPWCPMRPIRFTVAAEFETASGLRVSGLVGVTTDAGEVEISEAVLLFDGKYLFVPHKHDMPINALQEHDETLRSAIADALGTSPVSATLPA